MQSKKAQLYTKIKRVKHGKDVVLIGEGKFQSYHYFKGKVVNRTDERSYFHFSNDWVISVGHIDDNTVHICYEWEAFISRVKHRVKISKELCKLLFGSTSPKKVVGRLMQIGMDSRMGSFIQVLKESNLSTNKEEVEAFLAKFGKGLYQGGSWV
jgi:hypothetical protein